MNRDDVDWWGYWPAAPTPFDADGRLDVAAWQSLLELYVQQGVHGVLVNGSTGEWFSQTRAERERVIETAVEAVAGRIPVLAGVTAYTAIESGELARHAAAVGADGVLATPPPYVHPSPAEILAFYVQLSNATDLPFMIYNWPRGVSVDISAHPGLVEQLVELDHVVAVKDSTGDWLRMLGTVEAVSEQVRVFGSFLHRRGLAVLLGLGGDGNIDGGGVGAPFAVPFYEAVRRGDRAAAEVAVDQYVRFSGALIRPDYSGRFASPISQVKAVMKLLGQPGGQVRPPLLPLVDEVVLAEIEKILLDSGLLEGTR
jgi:dihydrodipicolinate synthase/N-acetylneuraminate lyase